MFSRFKGRKSDKPVKPESSAGSASSRQRDASPFSGPPSEAPPTGGSGPSVTAPSASAPSGRPTATGSVRGRLSTDIHVPPVERADILDPGARTPPPSPPHTHVHERTYARTHHCRPSYRQILPYASWRGALLWHTARIRLFVATMAPVLTVGQAHCCWLFNLASYMTRAASGLIMCL